MEHPTSNIERRTRRRLLVGCALAVALVAGAIHCGAQPTNASSAPSLDSFKIITRNNIFDPNRSGGRIRTEGPRQRTPSRTVDSFALVGTMSYSKGKFAFFDGSSSQYKKVLEPGANIAGYTVKDINPNAVTLAASGKEFEMKVGAQLRNEGDNKWQLSKRTDEPANPEPGGETTAVESTAPPTGANPAMNDVLKRLMELRQQELK